MLRNKSCLKCSYLYRERSYWNGGSGIIPIKGFWKYKKTILNKSQRDIKVDNTFSFLGEDKKRWDVFKKNIDAKENPQAKVFRSLNNSILGEESLYERAIALGFKDDEIPESPPKKDKINCYMQQWQSSVKLDKFSLSKFKCEYFCKFKEKRHENMSLEGIEKMQMRQGFRFSSFVAIISLVLIIISIIFTIFFGYLDYTGDKKWQSDQLDFLKENNYILNQNSKLLNESKELRKDKNNLYNIENELKRINENIINNSNKL